MEVETSVPEPAVQLRGKWRRAAVPVGAFVTVLYALTTLGHWNATLPQGTDSTWLRQLHEFFRTDAIFGRDVIWTFGPYGFLYAFTTPDTAMYVLIGRAFLAISCGLALWTISRDLSSNVLARCLWSLACIATIALAEQNLSLFAPTLLLLFVALGRQRRADILIPLALAAALASLVKVSAGIASGCVVTILALHDGLRRRVPWISVTYFAGLLLFWLLARQPIDAVADFIRNAWEMSRSYAQVMGAESFGATDVIIAFLGSGLITIVIVVVCRWGDDRFAAGAMAGALALWLFVVFKGACVRQGEHLLLAGPGALLAILLVATLVPKRRWLRALLALSLLLAWSTAQTASGQRWQIPREVVRTFTTIPDSFAWLGQRVVRSDKWPTARATWIDPRTRPDLTRIRGPVGVFPFGDFDLKKLGIERRTRPVMEAYQAATPYLSGLNAKFLASPAAPQTLLWNVFPMDDHPATMEDALLWPEVLARYDFQSQSGDYLVLTRSPHPRRYELVPLKTIEAVFDEQVEVPLNKSGMVWMSIDLAPSTWLKARTFLYKPPVVRIELEETGLGSLTYRLIPEMASCGYLLNPLVRDTDTFRALFPGQPRSVLKQHQILRVGLGRGYPGDSTGYERKVTYHFSELRFSTATTGSAQTPMP